MISLHGMATWYASRREPAIFSQEAVRSIVMIELTRLGDVISALPAVKATQRAYPHAAVRLIVRRPLASLVRRLLPGVRVVGVHDMRTVRGMLEALITCRTARANIVVSLGPGRSNGLTALLSGIRCITGYLDAVSSMTPYRQLNVLRSYGIAGATSSMFTGGPIRARAFQACAALGVQDDGGREPLVLPPPRSARARKEAAKARPTIVLHPFAAWPFRCWPLAGYRDLVAILLERTPHDILLMGDTADRAPLEGLFASIGPHPRVRTMTGAGLVDVGRAIARASLFVGSDSGPLHLACALGVPSVGLFGPAEPALTKPAWDDPARLAMLFHAVDCSPCDQTDCIRPARPCLAAITPEEVAAAGFHFLHLAPETRPHG